jgi:hypothetical protein
MSLFGPLYARRLHALALVASLSVVMLAPRLAAAQNKRIGKSEEDVTVETGQPAVWSLGQAHYLLANLHLRDRRLSVDLPSSTELNPNKANSSRLDVYKSFLGVEGQYDQAMAVRNGMMMDQYRRNLSERRRAQGELEARRRNRDELSSEIKSISLNIAGLQEQNRQLAAARLAADPADDTPSAAENANGSEIAKLTERKTLKEARREEIDGEIESLHTESTADVAPPAFEEPSPETVAKAGLPNSEAMTKFVGKAIESFDRPNLAASVALDNFVGMQYEIVAKQLTLLRDEVGPDERVIFLELPSSIYTVAGEANDYVAQVEWHVDRVYDEVPAQARRTVLKRYLKADGYEDVEGAASRFDVDRVPVTLEMLEQTMADDPEYRLRQNAVVSPFDQTTDLPHSSRVRTLDIIPRQSAVNVNEYQAVAKQKMFLAGFKFLIGFAGTVNYQRQREQYQQFMQQDLFASGYGKGDSVWGWTFGALPGSRSLAPGIRTTYAVLAVPRDALALELVAKTRAFKRGEEPHDAHSSKTSEARYLLMVPSDKTESFWITGASYTPVAKGKRTTVMLDGRGFSPQLGVLVNGVPLSPRVSIAGRAVEEMPTLPGAESIKGEFEVLNSGQIVLGFSMPVDYVGTPEIMLVTPEKTASINSFRLTLFYHQDEPERSLREVSLTEPMFLDNFSIVDAKPFRNPTDPSKDFVTLRLRGAGLRPKAQIWVNEREIRSKQNLLLYGTADVTGAVALAASAAEPSDDKDKFALERGQYISGAPPSASVDGKLREQLDQFGSYRDRLLAAGEYFEQESTNSYVIRVRRDADVRKWSIRFRQPTKQGFETGEATAQEDAPETLLVRAYTPEPRGRATIVVRITAKGITDLRSPEAIEPFSDLVPIDAAEGVFEKTFHLSADASSGLPVLRSKITLQPFVGAKGDKARELKVPIRPRVTRIENPATGDAKGDFDTEPDVIIRGADLQNVERVFFGSKPGTIVSRGSRSVLMVRAPKSETVADGEKNAVPVRLETDTSVDGVRVTNDEDFAVRGPFYTFLGKPKTNTKDDKSIIVVVPKEFKIAEPPKK